MPLETSVTYISDLNPLWPTSADAKSDGDDHIRNNKAAMKNSFPFVAGPVPIAHDQFASKQDISTAMLTAVLPTIPSGTGPFELVAVNGAFAWQPANIMDNETQLAMAQAIAFSN